MKCRRAYAIMSVGKNDESVQSGTQKAQVFQHLGFSIPLRQGGLCLRLATAYYTSLVSVQPFADVVANYTSQNGE